MINSRHILNLSIGLIIKPHALDKTFCYKCNVTNGLVVRIIRDLGLGYVRVSVSG